MTTVILTEAAFIALLPPGVFLFFVLDRYTAPRVPESVFEEFKVLVAFIVGIPAGLPLALLFLTFAGSVQGGNLLGGLIYLLFFVAVANLERIVFLRFRTFSGTDTRSRKAAFYALGFGTGNSVSVLLAAANLALGVATTVDSVVLMSLLSVAMALLEGWGGLRFAAAHARGASVLAVLAVETFALVAIAPIYGGLGYTEIAVLAGLIAVLLLLVVRDEERYLRPLLKPRATRDSAKPFGRTGSS